MQMLILVLVAAVAGVFTGALQLRLYISKPDIVKPYYQHFDDLRRYLRSACVVLAAVLLLVILFHPTLLALQLSAFAFTLSWIIAVVSGARLYCGQQTEC